MASDSPLTLFRSCAAILAMPTPGWPGGEFVVLCLGVTLSITDSTRRLTGQRGVDWRPKTTKMGPR
jgi:hypothetical protein